MLAITIINQTIKTIFDITREIMKKNNISEAEENSTIRNYINILNKLFKVADITNLEAENLLQQEEFIKIINTLVTMLQPTKSPNIRTLNRIQSTQYSEFFCAIWQIVNLCLPNGPCYLADLANFYLSLENHDRSQINVLSLACGKFAKQQVHPWVFEELSKNPEVAITIDLFDEEFKKDALGDIKFLQNCPQGTWIKQEDDSLYKHRDFNLLVRIHAIYFPLSSGHKFSAEALYPWMKRSVTNFLDHNKTVVLAQHTPGGDIDPLFIKLAQELEQHKNSKLFILFAHTVKNMLDAERGERLAPCLTLFDLRRKALTREIKPLQDFSLPLARCEKASVSP